MAFLWCPLKDLQCIYLKQDNFAFNYDIGAKAKCRKMMYASRYQPGSILMVVVYSNILVDII